MNKTLLKNLSFFIGGITLLATGLMYVLITDLYLSNTSVYLLLGIILALAGSMASVCAYKLVFLRMLGFDMHGRPAQKCIGAGKVYYVFIDSKVWENLNDRNKSFFLLHEVGHIVLGHLDNQNCMIAGNGLIINPEYERQANVYARETSGKKADAKNAEYALLEANDFLKLICEQNEIKIEDLTLNLLNNY